MMISQLGWEKIDLNQSSQLNKHLVAILLQSVTHDHVDILAHCTVRKSQDMWGTVGVWVVTH